MEKYENNDYEQELLALRPDDPVQHAYIHKSGYLFLVTGGHGFLVVPTEDKYWEEVVAINSYGYVGDLAVYLEEDVEAFTFLERIGKINHTK